MHEIITIAIDDIDISIRTFLTHTFYVTLVIAHRQVVP